MEHRVRSSELGARSSDHGAGLSVGVRATVQPVPVAQNDILSYRRLAVGTLLSRRLSVSDFDIRAFEFVSSFGFRASNLPACSSPLPQAADGVARHAGAPEAGGSKLGLRGQRSGVRDQRSKIRDQEPRAGTER